MYSFKKLGFVSVVFVALLTSCDSAGGEDNHAPEILSIETNPALIKTSNFFNSGFLSLDVAAVATDPDRDTLSYVWSASAGNLSQTTTNPAVLYLTENPGSVTITCTVSDGVETDAMSITIEVTD